MSDTSAQRDAIAEFLLARIAEDEAQAETCRSLGWFPAGKYGMTTVSHARVLAECAAKRAIIAEHSPVDPCDAHGADCKTTECDTLRHLSAVYSGHPDYQDEWKP